jgi:hypothetical protein
VKDYGNRTLGDTNISCIVTDLSGNGCVSNGDFVEFAAMDGTLFLSNVTYTLLVVEEGLSGLIGECELVFD